MKKQLVILGIVVILICVGLSGCDEETDVEKKILGSWKLVESIITIDDNTTSITDTENYTITTYYDNGTVKIELIGTLPRPPYAPHPGDIIWWGYKIENNNQIIYSNLTGNGTEAWNISISEDGKNLTLTFDTYTDNFTRETVRYIKIE